MKKLYLFNAYTFLQISMCNKRAVPMRFTMGTPCMYISYLYIYMIQYGWLGKDNFVISKFPSQLYSTYIPQPPGSTTHVRVRLVWHMPHGIALLATPKNGNSYYLLFEQPSSRHFHAISCVSSSLCSSSQTTEPLPGPLAATLTN